MTKTRHAKRHAAADALDLAYMGPEPADGVVIADRNHIDFARGLFWYNYHGRHEDAKQWLTDYLKTTDAFDKETKRALRRVPKTMITMSIGAVSKLLLKQWQMPPEVVEAHNERVKALARYAPEKKRNVVKFSPPSKDTVIRGLIDEELDMFYRNARHEFSAYDILVSQNAASRDANAIRKWIKEIIAEIKLGEGYESMSKYARDRELRLLNKIVADCDRLMTNKRRTRKPRKGKAKSTASLTSKLQYLDRIDELKVVSITPSNIIGAQQLWAYHAKYRRLIVLEAADENGLTVAGTTIKNIDESKSMMKTLRKPENILPTVVDGGKIALRRLMGSIKAKAKNPTGRCTTDMVLLRTVK